MLLLALAVGLCFMQAQADGAAIEPTQTAQPTQTATITPWACVVTTGIDGGTVNLRRCGGTDCEVLDIVTEGERLTILTAGAWANVTTSGGVTGWINSNYCKGK
jgi:uncharacterized protein YgiM (DUF1202 family)